MPAAPALASIQKILTHTSTLIQEWKASNEAHFEEGLHLGLLLYVFEQRLDRVRTRLSQRSKRVLLQSWSMELAQLHGSHVGGEEGLSQLQCRDWVLWKEPHLFNKTKHFTLHGSVSTCSWFGWIPSKKFTIYDSKHLYVDPAVKCLLL